MTQKDRERAEAITQLREWFPVGSTVYTILRHVSRSGMQREIGVLASLGEGDFRHPNHATARACGYTLGKSDGVKVGGCGMDMGFSVAYNISATLYPTGHGCVGEGCKSNDHSNGDRDYTPHGNGMNPAERAVVTGVDHWHKDGGYALSHRWL